MSFRQTLHRIGRLQRTLHTSAKQPTFATRSTLAFVLSATALAGYTLTRPPLQLDATLHPAGAAQVPPPEDGKGLKLIPASEVKKHNTNKDCWVVLENEVWDVTDFLSQHPGGAAVVVQQAGKDATSVYKPLHPPNTLRDNLSPSQHIGTLDPATLSELQPESTGPSEAEEQTTRRANLPPLGTIINLDDFERAAQHVLGNESQAFCYYASVADDGVAFKRNRNAFEYLNLLPRTLVPVSQVDVKWQFLGKEVPLPVFIAPAALARLGHPDGEMNLTRGAAERGALQAISSNASCSLDELFGAQEQAVKDGLKKTTLWYQLYVHRDRPKSERVIRKAVEGGCEAIVFTVDAPVGGKREKDLRSKGVYQDSSLKDNDSVSGAQFSSMDVDLAWKDIAWIRSIAPNTPLLIKGLSTTADVKKAYEHGVNGVILSNHGGRQLDSAPAPLATLIRLRQEADFKKRQAEGFEVYIDGGIRRGTDVVKALCCGANGVAMGRPFLYAQSCYGEQGVRRVFDIMEEEIATTMRLLGVNNLKQLGPQHVELLDGLLGKSIVQE